MRFLDYVFTLLIAHILVSGCKYYYVKRLDKGGTPKEFSPAVDRIISCLALLPMILDAFYTYTVGLFDHFLALVQRNQQIHFLHSQPGVPSSV